MEKCGRTPAPVESATNAASVGSQAARIRHFGSACFRRCIGQRSPGAAPGQHIASAVTHSAANWHVSQATAIDRSTATERMNPVILLNLVSLTPAVNAPWAVSAQTSRLRTICRTPRGSVLAFWQEVLRTLILLLALVFASDAAVRAQDPDPPSSDHQHQHDAGTTGVSWSWSTDANVFYGYNHQQRRKAFTQFSAWESQNWFMLMGGRQLGAGHLTLHTMVSLEPFTMDPLGSPQLYQTGESYNLTPLVNYQHPHDLIMGLGATYRIERPRIAYLFGAHLVGSPAIGPIAFMHRESARSNPQVPLAHHALDSTHITPGVLTAGVEIGGFIVEGSAFRGEEPDENRRNLERPRLNSWSSRISWRRGPWQAQVSGGLLHEPEWFEPYNQTRLTASIGFNGDVLSRRLDTTLAWGREIAYNGFNDRADSYLLEWDLHATDKTSLYGRAEDVRKQIFGLGFHPKGLNHPHFYSDIDAVTVGVIRDVVFDRWGRFGLGVDVTGYRTSKELALYYATSRSYHVFLRWRPNRTSMDHVH